MFFLVYMTHLKLFYHMWHTKKTFTYKYIIIILLIAILSQTIIDIWITPIRWANLYESYIGTSFLYKTLFDKGNYPNIVIDSLVTTLLSFTELQIFTFTYNRAPLKT